MNALPSTFLPLASRGLNDEAALFPPSQASTNPAEMIPGPSGATAQTGGFAQAGVPTTDSGTTQTHSAKTDALTNHLSSFSFGASPGGFPVLSTGGGLPAAGGDGFAGAGRQGGLASSPNVPVPGSSIDPATGKPHTAGLTRAELDAKKAAAAAASAELSGREQAARQLTGGLGGGAVADGGEITPGLELPGGWGPTKQVPLPGSSPNAPTSVYQDIAQGLEKVGKGAYGFIPQGLKDALNPDAPVDKGKQPMGSPPKGRRSSVGVLLENAKTQAEAIIHEVQDAFKDDGRRPSTTTGPVGAAGAAADGGVFNQVKQFFAEAAVATGHPTAAGTHTGLAAPRTSLPSDEVAGALPGERSTGVGALPGPASEAGVAVLPDEKKENQGIMPGEVSAGVGASPGKSDETGVAVLPDERVNGETAAPSSNTKDLAASSAAVPTSTAATALAPPLPATHLGQGAAHGATNLDKAGLPAGSLIGQVAPQSTEPIHSNENTTTAEHVAGDAVHPPKSESLASTADTRHANDRSTSSASVTAIRHGHEGTPAKASTAGASPLATSVLAEHPGADVDAEGTGGVVGVGGAKSVTPGEDVDGVGHPSTRGEGTTREPGTYPSAEHGDALDTKEPAGGGLSAVEQGEKQDREEKAAEELAKPSAAPSHTGTSDAVSRSAEHDSKVDGKSTSAATAAATTAPATSGSHPISAASPTSTPASPVNKQTEATRKSEDMGHRRSGSNASTGSNGAGGKKKVGFMNKLKGEIKVLGGKMSHDEKKVREGERLKHGE